MTPGYIFDLFFDDEVINYTITMTNLYAMQREKPTFSVTADEIHSVLAILLISDYVQLPSRRMFWENSDDVHNPAVSSIMSVNRFEKFFVIFILLTTKTFQLETRWQRFGHCIAC